MATQDLDEVITMKHPKLGTQRATASRRAFNDSWKELGWVIDDKTDPAEVQSAPTATEGGA